MQIAQVTLYHFEELPEEIQQTLIEQEQTLAYEHNSYPWHSENEDTLYRYADAFDISITSYAYGSYRNDHIHFELNDPEQEEITETMSLSRFYRYIHNNFFSLLYEPRTTYYCRNEDGTLTRNCVSVNSVIHTSKVYLQDKLITGYCLDYDLTKPLRDFLENPYPTTLTDLFKDCLNSWLETVNSDIEHYYSESYIREYLEDQDTLYTKDGVVI